MRKTLSGLLILLQAGCATVVSGKNQDVMIRSNPPGAEILIDGTITGKTPMMASLARKRRHTIELSSAQHGKLTRATTKGFNWWYLGNLILGGVVGLIVDPITGAMFDVSPEEVYVDFESTGSPAGEVQPG